MRSSLGGLFLVSLIWGEMLPAQVRWQKLETDGKPTSPITPGDMVYHHGDDILYLYIRDFGASLHAWTGTGWDFRTSPDFPAKATAAIAYDPAGARILLLGGLGPSGLSDETWTWDGQEWALLDPPQKPSGRFLMSMVADLARGRVVMFGGIDDLSGSEGQETWEWDGTTWIQRFPATIPPARIRCSMVYDSLRERVVLHGGTGGGRLLTDTWEWDGTDWWNLPTDFSPPPGRDLPMAFDSSRDRTVLYIGSNDGDQTWEYDGDSWFMRELREPVRIGGNAMGYDEVSRQVLLLQAIPSPLSPPAETWSYAPVYPALFEEFGEGCAGRAGFPHLAARQRSLPWTGDEFVMELSSLSHRWFNLVIGAVGTSRESFQGVPLPLSLGILGRRDCDLLVRPEWLTVMRGRRGRAKWVLEIPSDPSILGLEFFTQAFVLDFSGFRATNGGKGQVGGR